MSGKTLYSKVWVWGVSTAAIGDADSFLRTVAIASSSMRGQFSFSSTPRVPGDLRLHPGSAEFCQSLHKEREEMEDLAPGSGPTQPHPVSPLVDRSSLGPGALQKVR